MPKRWLVIGAAVVVVGGIAGGAWWVRHQPKPTGPNPPEITTGDHALDTAAATARAKVVANPSDAGTWGRFGQMLLANGLTDPARACFTQASRLDPNQPRWAYLEGVSYLLRDPAAALPSWQRAADHAGDDEFGDTARLRWAEALAANDRPAEAEAILHQVLARRPDGVRVHFDLGMLDAAEPAIAIDHLRRCLGHPAARKRSTTRLAALYARTGQSALAAEFAAKAEQFAPDADWPDPYLEEIATLAVGRSGLFVQAEKQHQQGNVPLAARLYQEVIEQYPDEARAYVKLGMLLTETGQYGQAEHVLRDGLKVAPDQVQALFFLAVALFHQAEKSGFDRTEAQAQLKEAVAVATRATELKPDHGFAHLYRGLALKHLGRPAEALNALREAVRCTPESVDPHLHLGEALWESGDVKEGERELTTAIRLAGPGDKRPQATLDRLRKARP